MVRNVFAAAVAAALCGAVVAADLKAGLAWRCEQMLNLYRKYGEVELQRPKAVEKPAKAAVKALPKPLPKPLPESS